MTTIDRSVNQHSTYNTGIPSQVTTEEATLKRDLQKYMCYKKKQPNTSLE